MNVPAWGIAVIALCCLVQIPAVVVVSRYCEVDPEDLPTPPMRAYWRDGGAEGAAPDGPDEAVGRSGVRCTRCGATNDPAFGRCQNCVAQL